MDGKFVVGSDNVGRYLYDGICPLCGCKHPEIEAPNPDADGNYRVCPDCGEAAREFRQLLEMIDP